MIYLQGDKGFELKPLHLREFRRVDIENQFGTFVN